jgi:pyruvate/2-oxoglutarate dehydrogenase complex dihydrolipoamide acyltransferase (E2) component
MVTEAFRSTIHPQSHDQADTPMSTDVLFPKIGFSMNEGTLSEWLVSNGAAVRAGQPIYSLESEKSVQEVEAPASGTLTIIGAAGEVYRVGEVIARID